MSNFSFTFHFHALEKEMATHSSILAWRIPGMEECGGLPSVGSHKVGQDWSDLAAAAAAFHYIYTLILSILLLAFGFFQFSSIFNKAAMNSCCKSCFGHILSFLLGKYLEMKLMGHGIGMTYVMGFLWQFHKKLSVFQSSCTILYSHQHYIRVLIVLYLC